MIDKDKYDITGLLYIPFSKYYNATNTFKKRLSKNEINTMIYRTFITLKNNTQSSFMEVDKDYKIVSYTSPYHLSKINSIDKSTCYGRYIIYIHNGYLYGHNIYTNINYEVKYADYGTKMDIRINSIMNELVGDDTNIGGICINGTKLILVLNSNKDIVIVSANISYKQDSIELTTIEIIKKVNKEYIKHIFNIETNIINVVFHNDYLFLLSSSTNAGNILFIKWYKNFNCIGNTIYLTEMNIDGIPIAISVVSNKFVLAYSDISCYVKFFETNIENII